MSKEGNRKPPKRAKGDSNAKKLKNATILASAIAGKSTTEIAAAMEMSRAQVKRILNSDETRAIVEAAESRITELIEKAICAYEEILDNPIDATNRRNVARDILKNAGLIRETVDLNHSFPKPLIIERSDGSEVVLGTTQDMKAKK